VYGVTASTEDTGAGKGKAKATDKSAATGWAPTGAYGGASGAYQGAVSTTADAVARVGEWLQLRMPNEVLVTKYAIEPRTGAESARPRTWWLLGSNDGSMFTVLDWQVDATGSDSSEFSVGGIGTRMRVFRMVRLVVSAVQVTGTLEVAKLRIYGQHWSTHVLAPHLCRVGIQAPPTPHRVRRKTLRPS
jgi:hypothetical protein